MAEWIKHRINRLSDLESLDPQMGAEIDVRSSGSQIILSHEAFQGGDPLEKYLERYAQSHSRRLLIVNTKEDGLEAKIMELLKRFGIERFFFLDLPLPTLVRLAVRQHEKRVAVRVSEYEPPEAAKPLRGLAEWIWADCFDGRPPDIKVLKGLRPSFKVCLVSPELQGYPPERIADFKTLASDVDAVCTKHPELWR